MNSKINISIQQVEGKIEEPTPPQSDIINRPKRLADIANAEGDLMSIQPPEYKISFEDNEPSEISINNFQQTILGPIQSDDEDSDDDCKS